MTSQPYYKDRLGFDPNDAQYVSSTSTRRSGSRSSSHHHQNSHSHHSHTQHHHHTQQRSSSHHSASATHQPSASPARISISPGGASLDHYADISPAKKAKQTTSALQQPQGGYEDALTQFKGTKSVWEYFVENWDILCKSFRATVEVAGLDTFSQRDFKGIMSAPSFSLVCFNVCRLNGMPLSFQFYMSIDLHTKKKSAAFLIPSEEGDNLHLLYIYSGTWL